MTAVTINGNTYSDDGTETKDMLGRGYATWFFPLVGDVVIVAGQAQSDADRAEVAKDLAVDAAAGQRGTSSSSVTIGTGTKNFVTQPDLLFSPGSYVTASSVSSPNNIMHGSITSYDSVSGNISLNITSKEGTGTFDDWIITLSGGRGAVTVANNSGIAYRQITSGSEISAGDLATVLECMAAVILTPTSISSLGEGFIVYIKNSSTGDVQVSINTGSNPDDEIGGGTTYTLVSGNICTLLGDGGNLLRVIQDIPYMERQLNIFDPQSSTLRAASTGELIVSRAEDVNSVSRILATQDLFLVFNGATATSEVFSSPDLVVFDTHSLPASGIWNFIAINEIVGIG